jgi:2-polyprenyl-6-methoxyphenol hydroxylase-like FAD-dependent oxidoreductase
MAAAIKLRELGWAADLIEIDPQWRVYGAGISITGPTYRAARRLGIAEEVCMCAATVSADQLPSSCR